MVEWGNIIVTGVGGVVGTAVVPKFRANTDRYVTALTRRDVDLAATVALFQSYHPTIVYHLTARVHGIMGNIFALGQAYLDNVRVNANMVEVPRLAGARKVMGNRQGAAGFCLRCRRCPGGTSNWRRLYRPDQRRERVSISIQETADLIHEVSGRPIETQWDRSKPDGQRLCDYDLCKLNGLGFQTKFSLAQALRITYNWYAKSVSTARR